MVLTHPIQGADEFVRFDMMQDNGSGCTPDKCEGCPGCGGEAIEKITLRVEWQHKGIIPENEEEIIAGLQDISSELVVSGVELVIIHNTFGKEIPDNSSTFYINKHPLADLVEVSSTSPVSVEMLRKGIFQALLRNL